MNKQFNKITNPINFGNGWGIYVDIENSDNLYNNYELMRKKYIVYEDDDEYEYYERQYQEKKHKKYIDEIEIEKSEKTLSNLLFRIGSTTLVTIALSYCVICAL